MTRDQIREQVAKLLRETVEFDLCGVIGVQVTANHITDYLLSTLADQWEEAIQVAQDEPECPGAIPQAMIAAVERDPEECLRAAVRATKKGIIKRLKAKADAMQGGGK